MFSVSLQVSGRAGSSGMTPAPRPRNCGHWSAAPAARSASGAGPTEPTPIRSRATASETARRMKPPRRKMSKSVEPAWRTERGPESYTRVEPSSIAGRHRLPARRRRTPRNTAPAVLSRAVPVAGCVGPRIEYPASRGCNEACVPHAGEQGGWWWLGRLGAGFNEARVVHAGERPPRDRTRSPAARGFNEARVVHAGEQRESEQWQRGVIPLQ